MARKATTFDVFNAVAEPQRRQILDLLAGGERSVNDLVQALGIKQPQVSKHLNVLKQVGLVSVRGAGKQRIYHLNGQALEPIHAWTVTFDRFWSESFDRLDAYLTELQKREPPEKHQDPAEDQSPTPDSR